MAVALIVAVLVSSLSMFAVLPLLRRRALDHPNERSLHTEATPRGGGISVLTGVAVGLVVAYATGALRWEWETPVVLGSTFAMGALGFVDDIGEISARRRLSLQIAGAIPTAICIAFATTSSLFALLIIAVIGSLWLVSFVNAFNFMDGINGISALTVAVAGGWYSFLGSHAHDSTLQIGGLLAAAAVGFLPWNAPRARVFLGDIGSYSAGTMIGVLAIIVTVRLHAPLAAVAPLVIYLVDTGFTLAHRATRREPLMQAHREHAYQRYVALGLPHFVVALAVSTTAAAVCVAVRFNTYPFAEIGVVLISVLYIATPLLVASKRQAR